MNDVMRHDADEALRRLVDLASHQLKNPLQAIVVNAEVVRIHVGRALPELWSTLERHAAAIETNVRLLDRRLQLLVQLARADGEPEAAVQPARLCADLVETAHFDVGPVPVLVEVGEEAAQGERGGRARPGHLVKFLLTLLDRARTGDGGEVRVRGVGGNSPGPELEVSRAGATSPPFGGDDWTGIQALARDAGVDELTVDDGGASVRLRFAPA